jgi:hypothetical protein
MSLWPIKTVTGIIEYGLCDGGGGAYAPDLCVEPKIYKESIDVIHHFFYEPSNDLLIAYILFRQKAWPGWGVSRFEWSAETGEFINRASVSIWTVSWNLHAGIGSYNKTFCVRPYDWKITEVPWNTISWTSPMWSMDMATWNPNPQLRYVVVNLQDNLIAGIKDWNLEVWDISGTPTRRGSMRLPNVLGYLAMESREICWVITKDGIILKANYKDNPPRWEMITSIQNPSPDAINYFITWDQKRGRVAVMRQRPDAADGACQCQFEFYRPLIKVVDITEPVPVGRHRAGDLTEFVAHLYGAAGEGITPYRVLGSLQTPALGSLLRAEGVSAVNGSISLLYRAPDEPGEDTLIVEATITDGE